MFQGSKSPETTETTATEGSEKQNLIEEIEFEIPELEFP